MIKLWMNKIYFTFYISNCPDYVHLFLLKNFYNHVVNDHHISIHYGDVKIDRSVLNKGVRII